MHGNVVQNGTNRRGERLFGRRASSSGGYSMVVEIGIPVTTGLPQMKAAEALAKSSASCNHVLAYVVRALTAAVAPSKKTLYVLSALWSPSHPCLLRCFCSWQWPRARTRRYYLLRDRSLNLKYSTANYTLSRLQSFANGFNKYTFLPRCVRI
jgi:hypothetical protein